MMDLNLRRNYTASGSLDNLHHGHHDEQSYPHYHSVLSRHLSRSMHHSTSVLDKEKSRKGKHHIKESINILPTIEDDEAKEETLKIPEEAEEIAESGKHTLHCGKTRILLSLEIFRDVDLTEFFQKTRESRFYVISSRSL